MAGTIRLEAGGFGNLGVIVPVCTWHGTDDVRTWAMSRVVLNNPDDPTSPIWFVCCTHRDCFRAPAQRVDALREPK